MKSISAAAITFDSMPDFVAETRLIQRFATEVDGRVFSKEISSSEGTEFFSQVECKGLAGFGRAETRRLSLVKATAEFYERRLMFDVFCNELASTPLLLQTSNGFAVHLTQSQANVSAKCEAIERHLLQYTFFKHGWNGFGLLKKQRVGRENLFFLVSKYEISGIRAGMVVATSDRYKGISMGYFAEEIGQIETSKRWSHAVSEALDKIEPFLKIIHAGNFENRDPIERSIIEWMTSEQEDLIFGSLATAIPLVTPEMEIREFDLSSRWNLDFPLKGAFCFSSGFLPLIVSKRIRRCDSELISTLENVFQLEAGWHKRNPIL